VYFPRELSAKATRLTILFEGDNRPVFSFQPFFNPAFRAPKSIIISQKVIMSDSTMITFFRKGIIIPQKASLFLKRHQC